MKKDLQLLFVIGMQKSGTSLLNRMLMQQSYITNPFLPEGTKFWGDLPPFTPQEKPCGELFQKYHGKRGHYLDSGDFNAEHQTLLNLRIKEAKVKTPILMNKNPYNSVRVSWIKSIFPDALIYAVYRHPTANIYSLLKKYHNHEGQGAPPDDGWWGVKPDKWSHMLQTNKINQCILQWNAVNKTILDSSDDIDCFLDYESICQSPNKITHHIKETCHISAESHQLPSCKSFNDEHLIGSRLLSKNKELRKHDNFNLHYLEEDIEVAPFTPVQCQMIQNETNVVWQQLNSKSLSSGDG